MEICAHLWFKINHKFTQIPTNFISPAKGDYSSPIYDFFKKIRRGDSGIEGAVMGRRGGRSDPENGNSCCYMSRSRDLRW